ncbi:MAG: SDR family oxidoreductase [Caldilinea sp. CFX5]|nr:SDR family oxidoreductase [Caldilinea sp. CFX5]
MINPNTTLPNLPSAATEQTLRGKVCLITGASRTLGATIARALAVNGAQVAVNYHQSAAAADALCAELIAMGVKSVAIGADVTDLTQVEQMIATTETRLGAIDILVNNVGPYVDTPFLDLSLADFDRILAGNVRATFLLTQTVGRLMKARGNGNIINIAATDIFHRSHSIYGLAKQGVVHLTEAMALELAPAVRLNAIAPDLIADNEEMTAEFTARSVGGTPMQRLVTRAEVAQLVCLLCTPAFAMMTGQTLVLDGGRAIPRIAFGPVQ